MGMYMHARNACRWVLTYTPLLQHVHKLQLAGKRCLLAPQPKPCHIAQILCLGGSCSADIQDPGIWQPLLNLHNCLHTHPYMVSVACVIIIARLRLLS